jgi:hypothetical protein
MDVGSLGSRPNSKKYSEKDVNEAYWLKLYPMANHGNYKSQSWVWPFWRPYFHNPCFRVYTIHLANLLALGWSYEIVRWSFNAFSHKSWKSLRNFVPWLVRTLAGTLNSLNIMSKNAYTAPSLLRFSNGTNSNHLEKCSIITKIYWLCRGVKQNPSSIDNLAP